MDRVTRKLANGIIATVDGKGYANLTREEERKLLLEHLYELEEEKDQRLNSSLEGLYKLEDWLYNKGGKDKPVELKSAIHWGALWIVKHTGAIDWDDMKRMYGEFMSKQMNLR